MKPRADRLVREHFRHRLEQAEYTGLSHTIECLDCGLVLVEKESNPPLFNALLKMLRQSQLTETKAVFSEGGN